MNRQVQADMPMRKIAIDGHVLEGRPQGTRTVLEHLLSEIRELGQARHFTVFTEENSPAGGDEDDFEFVTTGSSSFKRLAFRIPSFLRSHRRDVVIWQYVCNPLIRSKSYVYIHDILPFTHGHLFSFAFRVRCCILFYASMWFSHRIISVSNTTTSEICRVFPYFSHKTLTIRNGPSFPEAVYFSEPKPLDNSARPFILAVGRIEERKNIPLLANAFIRADLKEVDLVVVGRRDAHSALVLPEHDQIYYRTDVDDAELIELYREAALFVFPSSAEGFGLPLLDATLFGRPCIASNQTSMPEVAGDAAKLFDPTNSKSELILTNAIRDHFRGAEIEPLSVEERRAHFRSFNWRRGAQSLLASLGLPSTL